MNTFTPDLTLGEPQVAGALAVFPVFGPEHLTRSRRARPIPTQTPAAAFLDKAIFAVVERCAFDRFEDFLLVQGRSPSVGALHNLQAAVGIDEDERAPIRDAHGRSGSRMQPARLRWA